MDKDLEQNCDDAASSDSVLNTYEVTLKEQHAKITAYKNAMKSFGNALQFSILALGDLETSILAIYEDDWAFLQDILICFEDEQTVWKNFQRDVFGIVSLFRKYEDQFEEIEKDVQKRKKLLAKLTLLKSSIDELNGNEDAKQAANLRKIETEYESVEKEFFKEQTHLMETFPKCFGRRVGCLIEMFKAFSGVMKEFFLEIRQVHETVWSLLYQLPNTNPRIVIGGNEPCKRIEFRVRESQSAKRPKPKKSVTIQIDPGQIPPPPPSQDGLLRKN